MKTRTRAGNEVILSNFPTSTTNLTSSNKYHMQQLQLAEQRRKQEEEDLKRIKTVMRVENNSEIFVTDAPDVDFDRFNEEQSQPFAEKFATKEHTDIVSVEVDPKHAFKYFRELNQQSKERVLEVPDLAIQSGLSEIEKLELPQTRIERL